VPFTAQREQYALLIASGVSNSGARRRVGVNRKTGTRWRFGRSIPASGGRTLHYPPVSKLSAGVELAGQAAVLRYLSEDERVMIGDLRLGGATFAGDRS
jgi:hypothetical protein